MDPFAFWYGLINYEQRAPRADDLKLDRMRALLTQLGDPQEHLPILHVAGSKGKGSTAAMLATILQRAGYRVGLFTSPHLVRVEERFQIDGASIAREELAVLLAEVRDVVQQSTLAPTFFEVATAAALLYFVRRRVDLAVLEVGLGGRLDSTNVCLPLVALLTSISYDHTTLLGDRLASIAWEKAGILKPGRPAVSGVVVPEAREVIERVARERGAPLRQLGVDFHYRYYPGHVTSDGVERPRVEVTTWRRQRPPLELNLLGEHQAANAATALAALDELSEQGWNVPETAVKAGLAEVVWLARMELLGRRPLIVLDCAHNVASAQAVVETLEAFPPGRRLLVFAGSSDKDVPGMFRLLAPAFGRAFLTRYTANPRSVPTEQLAEWWGRASRSDFSVHSTPAEALQAARAAAGPEDLICITGSVFLAGEVRPLLTVATPSAGAADEASGFAG
jgi:dihydrofolate synthase/folylpolyglutamate synthase